MHKMLTNKQQMVGPDDYHFGKGPPLADIFIGTGRAAATGMQLYACCIHKSPSFYTLGSRLIHQTWWPISETIIMNKQSMSRTYFFPSRPLPFYRQGVAKLAF